MKITKKQLRRIIKEGILAEAAVTPENLVKVMFTANNKLVDIIKMVDDPLVKDELESLRILISDTAANYDGTGTSDPTQEYTGGRGGH